MMIVPGPFRIIVQGIPRTLAPHVGETQAGWRWAREIALPVPWAVKITRGRADDDVGPRLRWAQRHQQKSRAQPERSCLPAFRPRYHHNQLSFLGQDSPMYHLTLHTAWLDQPSGHDTPEQSLWLRVCVEENLRLRPTSDLKGP